MTGRLVGDITFNPLTRKQTISLEVDSDFREKFDLFVGKTLDVSIKLHREKRSLNANAYFHALVNAIALETGETDKAVKKRLVISYGSVATDKGENLGFKVPVSFDVSEVYDYVRCFGSCTEEGVLYNCYLVYKNTHDMDSKEFARLLNGAIEEAKELGIETAL